jgi:hypothetical protein
MDVVGESAGGLDVLAIVDHVHVQVDLTVDDFLHGAW